ncbi:hypothetical protein CUJ84_Chr004380 [Rhizobium leguminosarum]|uniref:Uncharacterized protein n=1 Tax=Rhizobium leguminosarum TaxID=384 RepID=A0A2K9Z8W5_RHILE|nr:hypothetical protein CUJ84_Chr004380 [Rhizobium leguminosarum]
MAKPAIEITAKPSIPVSSSI